MHILHFEKHLELFLNSALQARTKDPNSVTHPFVLFLTRGSQAPAALCAGSSLLSQTLQPLALSYSLSRFRMDVNSPLHQV